VVGGLVLGPPYSPVDDAISRLAADGASTRWLMSFGFVAFGVGVPLYGLALREALPASKAWIAAVVTGLATLGVAATPLDVSDTVDALHGLFATTGYVALALIPVLTRRTPVAVAVTAFIAACLVLTPFIDANGLLQRAGLTAGDLWIATTASAILRGQPFARATP
jgi:hypothetical membrane protein